MKKPRPDRNALVLLGLVVGLAAFVLWDQTRGAGDAAVAARPAADPQPPPAPPAAPAPESRPANDAGESYPAAGVM